VHPVAPYEPGGLDAVERLLAAASTLDVAVTLDLQHVYRQPALLARTVNRLKALVSGQIRRTRLVAAPT
jgi:hypothetical protein